MSESVKLQTGQIELGRIRDIRRAGVVILADGVEILTLTYIPDSALVLMMDGATYASGIGLVNQIGTPVEDAICDKINTYLGLKQMKLTNDNIKMLLGYIEKWNNGTLPIKTTGVGEVEGKGAKAKKVFKVDLGRTTLALDINYQFTIDDGMGNIKEFELPSMIKDFISEEFSKLVGEKELTTEILSGLNNSCSGVVVNWSEPMLTGGDYKEPSTLIATAIVNLYARQIANHKELEEAEKKKAERDEKNASKEPKKASVKDILYCMIQDKIIRGIGTDSNKLNMEITPAGYGYDYEAFVLEVVDPIYRFTQRKAIKESIETANSDSYNQYTEYGKILDEVLSKFAKTGKIDSEECVEYLNTFSAKEDK